MKTTKQNPKNNFLHKMWLFNASIKIFMLTDKIIFRQKVYFSLN